MVATPTPPPGPGVDARGVPVIDPTENVKALSEASGKRLDDLRDAETRRIDAEIQHVKEMAALRADYDDKLRDAEAKRIDAIRAVDVGNVSRAAEVAQGQAATLAQQVQASAETLRAQLAATATAGATSLANALEPIQKDIADLRRAQYEAQGQKTQVVEGRSTNSAAYAAAGFIFGLAGFVGLLIALLTK